MKNSLKNLKRKKYVISAILVILLVLMVGLISILNPSVKNIKVSKVLTNTKTLSASVIDGTTEGITSNNYDEIKYQININKDNEDTAIITASLSDNESKYARFKEVKNSVVSNNGKTITVTTKSSKVTLRLIVENAPYGLTINPNITINSSDENNSIINVDPVTITGKSVQGKVTDENGTTIKGIELGLYRNGEQVKNTYSKDNGEYVFSLGDLDNYEIKVEETKYKLVRFSDETTDQNQKVLNVVIKEVIPFSVNIRKTIYKLDLTVNGSKKVYNYNDETKVVKAIKNAKTIEGSIYYNINIKNIGEVKGTLTVLKDLLPEGLSFDESKNPGWVKEGKYLYYTVVEGTELEAFGTTSAKLILDIEKTNEAKTYINSAIASGDDYKYVAYYLNNNIYKEEYVVNSEKIEDVNPGVENFSGWYSDRNYTNKYDFDKEVTKDTILYGKVENKKITVTFIDKNPNTNAETVLDIVEINEGDSVDTVAHPDYNGYTFDCFTLNNICYNNEALYEDTIMYTSYDLITYNITYHLNDGSLETGKTNPNTYTVRDTFTLNNPSKEGYTFLGWTGTDLTENTLTVTVPVGSTGDREYTANYQIITSTLTIDPNGGIYSGNASPTSYTKAFGTILQIEDSSKTGYNFVGYNKDGGGTFVNKIFTFDALDATLIAQYQKIIYTIKYHNITEEEEAFLHNPTTYDVETETFTLNNPNTRYDSNNNPSEDFVGWNDGSGNVSLVVTIPKGSTGNREYTAVWNDNQDAYRITYELNGGVYDEGKTNPNTYTRQTETFTLNNPHKNGYTFTGWTGSNGDTPNDNVTIQKGSSGNKHFVANYVPDNYRIDYYGLTDEEKANLQNPTSYNIESLDITLHNPSNRNGYNFIGWSGTDLTGNTNKSVTIPTGSTGNREYTANWEIVNYSITYTLDGGTLPEGKTNPESYNIETPDITLFNPGKPAYTFTGWTGTDYGTQSLNVLIPTGSTGHRSYLAHYTPDIYHIYYDYDGGALPEGVTNPSTYTTETPDITFNNSVKEGYDFLHYKEGENIITSIPKGSSGDKYLKAYYKIKEFKVTYYNDTVKHGEEIVEWNNYATKAVSDPTKAHNEFLYWSEVNQPTYDANDPAPEFDFAHTKITSNKDLYAVFKPILPPIISYTPTLDDTTNKTWVCGNSNDDSCGDIVTITSGDPSDSNYTLYYKIGDGEVQTYTGPFPVYENITITAFAKKNDIYSEEVSTTINNVDTIAPTINQPSTGSMSFNMSVFGTAADAASGVKQFTLYAKEKTALDYDDNLTYTSEVFDGIRDHSENYDHTFSDLKMETEYIVKIVAVDYVGNVSEREVEVKTNSYVARVVGNAGTLWYTVDPDTKEFIFSTPFIPFDSIQAAVNYCAELQCTIQTNPILPVVNESVTIAENQNITIDLDGRIVASDENATFINNGELHIVDRNPRLDENNGHESIGKVYNTTDKAIVNNGKFVLGDGSSDPTETFIYPELDRPIIEGQNVAIEQNNVFCFFDGKLVSSGLTALDDHGEDPITQYSYNVTFTGENNKKIGTLAKVDSPEARIRSTYYTKLKISDGPNAFDSTNIGTVTTENGKLLSKIIQADNYGFIYDEVNDEIYSGNQTTANTTALSYIKLDFTDVEKGKFIYFDTFIDSFNSNSIGYVYVSEELGNTGTEIYRTTGNDEIGTKLYFLEGGKVYYIYFKFVKAGGDINKYEEFRISNFRFLGEQETTTDFKMYNDPYKYTFEKQNDGSIISTNHAETWDLQNSIAHSYFIYDLRNEENDIDLVFNYNLTFQEGGGGAAWIYVINNDDYQDKTNVNNRYLYVTSAQTNAKQRVVLRHGEVNYVHICFQNLYRYGYGDSYLKINSITMGKFVQDPIITGTELLHNENDTYFFDKPEYRPNVIRDLSGNNNYFSSSNVTLNDQQDGFVFDGSSIAFTEKSISSSRLDTETVEVEFSTTTTREQIYYMGSNQERISIATYNGYITVSNENTNYASTFDIPSDLADGNKHKIIVTFENNIFNAYYDGEPLNKRTNTDYYSGGKNDYTYIGGRSSGTNYLGTIYSVRTYNRVLTEEEINGTASNECLLLYVDASNYQLPNDKFISNNQSISNSVAHSYIKYDLTNVNEDKYLYVNVSISSESNRDYGYVYLTDSSDTPSNSDGRFISTSGLANDISAIVTLKKNQISYIHFMYTKDRSSNVGSDSFVIEDIRLLNEFNDSYVVDPDNYNKDNNFYFEKPVFNKKVDTVELLRTITLNTPIVVSQEKEVVLDLNGYNLTSDINDYIIKNNGKLTITDSDYIDRHSQNVNYITEQSRLYEEAKTRYLEDLAEYQEYAGLGNNSEPSYEYKYDHIDEYLDYFGIQTNIATYDFDYVSDSDNKEQTFTVTEPGMYTLEVWGAQGGSYNSSYVGGYGGYSIGSVELEENDKLYINVGGAGTISDHTEVLGGYNGGGDSHGGDCDIYTNRWGASGGGATSIATVSGELKDLDEENDKGNILIVSGGGGGAFNIANWMIASGGSAGGYVGIQGYHQNMNNHGAEQFAQGGTQTSGGRAGDGWDDLSTRSEEWFSIVSGKFGQGGMTPNVACSEGGAGGGGYYGGGAGSETAGAGGSSYIGNELLYNKKMVCYNCPTSTEESTKTETTTCNNATATADCAKQSNGYAKITLYISGNDIEEIKNNIPKSYNIKTEPIFVNYLDGIDFDSSVDINQLNADSNPTFSNIVSDSRKGAVVSTTSNAILNEQYATLTLDGAAVNVNVNSATGIHNRGNLILSGYAEVNANNQNTTGIFNESNGEIVYNNGTINAVGSSSTGLLNRSHMTVMNGIKATTNSNNSVALKNEALNDITFSNLNITGAGIGFREFSAGNTVINNSSIKSTGDSLYTVSQSMAGTLDVNNTSFSGNVRLNDAQKDVTINNSTMNKVYNYYGYAAINNSSLNYIDNRGETIINGSTITGPDNLILNYAVGIYPWHNQHESKMLLKDTVINSTATTSINVITNNDTMTVKNLTINNVNNYANSTVFRNESVAFRTDLNVYSESTAYLNIPSDITIDPSFGTAINNTGIVVLGNETEPVATEYNYSYTGHQEEFVAPVTGTYKLETWGATGAGTRAGIPCWDCSAGIFRGGYGAYASGTINLQAGDKLYIHVGSAGSYGLYSVNDDGITGYYGTYNGGGAPVRNPSSGVTSGAGGGATDISLSNEDNIWSYDNGYVSNTRSTSSYEQRIIVAGGGSACTSQLTCFGGYEVDPSTTQLGYGSYSGGGGYYGGSNGIGGSSYISNTLSNHILINGNEEMPDFNSTSGLMFGNNGNGYARISLVEDPTIVISTKPNITATNYGIIGSGHIIYYDGTISANNAIVSDIETVPNDYDIYKAVDSNNKETVTLVPNANSRPVPEGEEQYVAKIDNAKFTTIQRAIDASNNGDVIELLVDIAEQNMINIPATKTITIDYKGHTITSHNEDYLFKNLGNLTITDSENALRKNIFYGDRYIYNEGTLNVSKIYVGNFDYSEGIITNNGTLTLNSVKLDFGDPYVSNKIGISNSENSTVSITNSTLNLTYNNSFIDNNGSLTLTNNTISSKVYAQYFVNNHETGTATLDGNSYSVSGDDRYGRYLLNNDLGNATIINMTTHIEDVLNTGNLLVKDCGFSSGTITNSGVLTLTGNALTGSTITSTGLVIMNSGTYLNTFNINGDGLSIDNTDNLYSFIMNDGTINTTLNISATGISHIKSGTISVTQGNAVNNTGAGTIILGINDSSVESKNNTKPVITGKTYGIYTENPSLVTNFYDGLITGQKSYNVTIYNVESGYSIHRDYNQSTDIEQKYLTNEALFLNSTQNVYYSSIDELNTALSNGSIHNDDEIKVIRDITITKYENPIVIPSGLKILFNFNNKKVDKHNNNFIINNGELNASGGMQERLTEIMNKLNSGEYTLDGYGYFQESSYQKFVAPADGTYKIELWGAQGGNNDSNSGKGAYTSGEITLTRGETLYIYVGGQGGSTGASVSQYIAGGFNGGGYTNGQACCGRTYGSGGGATDVRYFTSTPSSRDLSVDSESGLASRIMVAAGGGGGFNGSSGGAAGGLTGQKGQTNNGYTPGPGATQLSGGINPSGAVANGSFGKGGSGGNNGLSTGGGGGYYGGAGSWHIDAAGGGSSYISGHNGSIAITSISDLTPKCNEDNTSVACSEHFTGKVFTSTVMKAGNEEMPDYSSNTNKVGNMGDGFARITFANVDTSEIVYTLDDAYRYMVQNGEYIPGSNVGISIVDSTNGNIFENNNKLTIDSGTYISEKGSIESEIVKNNENATLDITDGIFTKYYDSLGYRQYNSGSIINNSGIANVTNGTFYSNSSYINGHYSRVTNSDTVYGYTIYVYSSAIFQNNETGELTVTGGTYDGISSPRWIDDPGYFTGNDTLTYGELIYNYGTANISNIISHNSRVGNNTGTLTFTNISMDRIRSITESLWNYGAHTNILNTGDLEINDSSFIIKNSFVHNNGGNITINNTTIDRTEDGVYMRYVDDAGYGYTTSQVIRNIASENGSSISINNSYIYNKGSGEVLRNDGIMNIKGSTIEASNNNAINTYSGTMNIESSSVTAKNNAINSSNTTLSVIKNSSLISNTDQSINLTSNSTLTIGEELSSDHEVSKTYPMIKGETNGINNTNSIINFYDGIIKGKTLQVRGTINNIEAGYMIIDETEDNYKVNYLDRVQIIQNITQATASDEKKYFTLDEAFSEALDGDTLQMIANFSNIPDDVTAVNNRNNVTFDLNGKTIRQSNTLLLTNNGSLNIIDSSQSKTGEIIGVSGSNMINNNGTIKFTSGKLSSESFRSMITNNENASLTIKDNVSIVVTGISTLITNDGTLNIYNGAYLYNQGGEISMWTSSNNGLPMILNNNILNIVDLNNDDDDNTSSSYLAPWLYSYGNYQSWLNYSKELSYYDAIVRNNADGTVTIYGGIYNNNDSESPNAGKIIYNLGNMTIKNLDSYAYGVGYSKGILSIENCNFHNFTMGALTSTNNLTIKNSTINFLSERSAGILIGNDVRLSAGGTLLIDNVTFTGGNYTDENDYYIVFTGNNGVIKDSNLSGIAKTTILLNRGTLLIDNTTIAYDKPILNEGNLTIKGSIINSSGSGVTNSGTLNLTNGTTITASGGNAIDTSAGTVNVPKGITIKSTNTDSDKGIGINLSNTATVTLGELGGIPDQETPYIEGTRFGIYRSKNSQNEHTTTFNYYDGVIYGQEGPNAIYGGYSEIEEGYQTFDDEEYIDPDTGVQKHKEYLIMKSYVVLVAEVGLYTYGTNDETSPAQALQQAIDAAIVANKPVELRMTVDLPNDEFSLTASAPVTINLNGNSILYNSTYTIDPNITLNNSVGGSISKILASITNPISKNIIIYEMSDGTNLDITKTYTLYKDDNIIKLEKEELGKYNYKGTNDKLTPIKGRLYINELPKGSYRLVSSDDKSIEFSIDDEGNIQGNVTENNLNTSKFKSISEAKAELILTIQTGVRRYYYSLFIIPIGLCLLFLFIFAKKSKKNI